MARSLLPEVANAVIRDARLVQLSGANSEANVDLAEPKRDSQRQLRSPVSLRAQCVNSSSHTAVIPAGSSPMSSGLSLDLYETLKEFFVVKFDGIKSSTP